MIEAIEEPGAGHGRHGQVTLAGEFLECLELVFAQSTLSTRDGALGRLISVSGGYEPAACDSRSSCLAPSREPGYGSCLTPVDTYASVCQLGTSSADRARLKIAERSTSAVMAWPPPWSAPMCSPPVVQPLIAVWLSVVPSTRVPLR